MGVSLVTYRVVLKQAWIAGTSRRCWEICECSVSGAVRRIIARTPVVVGEGETQDARHAQAHDEACRMLAAFVSTAR